MEDHKTQRLCRQVEHALTLALSSESDVSLVSVEPAPTASRLLVTVAAADVRVALARLEEIKGRLRSDVAVAIRRRKVPELMFRVVV